jgi:glycosyltransferase involved in cell wall biosynthesis
VKTIIVTHSLSRQAGGLFGAVSSLARAVVHHGVDVRVLGLRDADTRRDRAAWHPLTPEPFDCRGREGWGFSPELNAALQAIPPADTVIHLHGLWKLTSQSVTRIARAHDMPHVVSPHGMLDPWALRQSSLKKRVARLLYEERNLAGASCLHALNEAELRQIRAYGLKGPVAVIPNGVDLPRQEPPRDAVVPDIPPDRKVLLFLSRLHPKKGLEPLIEAWRECAVRNPDWLLVVAGPDDGGYQARLESAVRRYELSGHVRFIGPRYGEDKDACLGRADAFVLPSFSEGFPLAVLEAMAFGLPVLMTPQCNFPEALQARAALAADPEVAALKKGLLELLSMDPEARQAMGQRGKALVTAHYSWDAAGAAMVAVYQWMLGKRDQPDCVVEK